MDRALRYEKKSRDKNGMENYYLNEIGRKLA